MYFLNGEKASQPYQDRPKNSLYSRKKGYSQEEFAAAAQLGRSYAGRVERGEQNVSVQSLIQIALTLEVEVGELFPSLQELKTPYRKRLEDKTG